MIRIPVLDAPLLRKLAEWDSAGDPVCSFYLDVDSREFPAMQDVRLRARALAHEFRRGAEALPKRAARSKCAR